MKQTLRIIIVMLVAVFAISQAFAKDNKKENISREELAMVQAKHIAKELAFNDETTKKFVETYCRCQQEIWALGPRHSANANDSSSKNSKPELSIAERLERSQKMLDIRKKYYGEYSQFLTEAQIDRVYRLEKKMMDRLARHKKDKDSKKHPRRHRKQAR